MNFKKVVFTILLVTMAVGAAMAQTSASSTTPIVATKAESLSITAAAPLATYNLGALAAQTLNISSYWNVNPARANVTICVYMGASGKMVGTGGNASTIDNTMVQTKVGAGAWANIDAGTGCGVAGGATLINTYPLSTTATRNIPSTSPKADSVQVQLNGVPSTYEADTYTGTLTLIAYAL